jgi:hypothetical protein
MLLDTWTQQLSDSKLCLLVYLIDNGIIRLWPHVRSPVIVTLRETKKSQISGTLE